MIGIYHSRDLDGYASGAIIKRKYPEAKMIGYDYGQPFDLTQIDGPVIMADVSMPMNIMQEIWKRSGWDFTWIDHHVSAINEYRGYTDQGEVFLKPILDNTISACEGTWNHLFPKEPMPVAIKLLGEYDTWRNQDKDRWENVILPFQFGMRMWCNSLTTFPSNAFDSDSFAIQVTATGKTILHYQRQQNEYACRAAFECEFEGLKAIALNGGGFNSDVFRTVYDDNKHLLMIPFQFNGKFWTVSLYTTSDDVNCSVIAKQWGGGGHKKAAGFQVDDIKKVFPNHIK